MALYNTLPVYNDVYSLVLLLFEYTKEYPREYKYTLGQDIKHDAINLVRSIYRANKARDKKDHLEEFLDAFELVKFELRLSVDLHLISIKKMAELTILMDKIGKQITGWRNSSK